MKLPSSWRIRSDLKALSIVEASKKADALNMEPMPLSNINKGIGKVSIFWNWAAGQYFDDIAPRPLNGLKIKIKSSPRDARHPFSLDQLTKIFNAPVYTGCKSEINWKDQGSIALRDSPKFWCLTSAPMGQN